MADEAGTNVSKTTAERRLPTGIELHSGERLVASIYPWWLATIGYYLLTLGLWEIWRRRHFIALTDQRLLHGKGIVLSKSLRSVPLSRVQDATYDRKLWAGGVQISSAGGSFGNLSDATFRPKQAKEFVHLLNEHIRHRQGHDGVSAGPEAPVDPAAALRRLQELKDEGLITADEYAQKRAEILARL